jgi:stalled ribosome rescue protein Dom34
MGAYHTIDLELNREFEITKTEWDRLLLNFHLKHKKINFKILFFTVYLLIE